jgi:acetylornithine deacetylase/succinyl-diaminopimelate desuccinylase-like protein
MGIKTMAIIIRSYKFYYLLAIVGFFLIPHLKAGDSVKPDRKYVKEIKKLADHPKIKKAFKRVVELESTTHNNLIYLTEIPAPPFKESVRAKAFADLLRNAGADEVIIDEEGNVVARRDGTGEKTVLIEGHLDTVFPEGTDVTVRTHGDTLFAPGIGDDTRGLSLIVTLLQAVIDADIRTDATLYFAGTVGEEGLGDLRGVKHLFNSDKISVDSYIAVDGGGLDRIVTTAVGSHRYRVTFKGPGGHSWGAFGLVNPHHALGRAIEYFSEEADPYSRSPGKKVSYNVGRIGGGTSVNSIPFESWMEVDMRSESPERLQKMDDIFQKTIQKALKDQNTLGRTDAQMTVDMHMVGDRPAGTTDEKSPLVQRAMASILYLGSTPRLGSGSTNSNIPFSKNISAITIGRGGTGRHGHSLNEWWLNKDGHLAIQNALLIIISQAGGIQ